MLKIISNSAYIHTSSDIPSLIAASKSLRGSSGGLGATGAAARAVTSMGAAVGGGGGGAGIFTIGGGGGGGGAGACNERDTNKIK